MSLWLFYIVYVTVAILSYGYLVTWRFCMWRFCNMAVLYVAGLYPLPLFQHPNVVSNHPCLNMAVVVLYRGVVDAVAGLRGVGNF